MKDNNINYDKLICSFDKDKVCKNENIDLFIDDSIENCNKVSKLGIETLLFTSKSNMSSETNLNRVYSWEDIYNFVSNYDKNK